MNIEALRLLANHLWQSTLFAIFAGLLTLALRKNRARVRHAVWLVASCKFLIPASLSIALGGQFAYLLKIRTAPPGALSMPPSLFVLANEVSQPFVRPAVAAPAFPVSPATISGSFSGKYGDVVPAVLFGLWACGFFGIAGSWFVRWRRIRAVARAATPVQLGLPIPALSSSALLEPGIFGIFRPTLLLPDGIVEHLSPGQLKAVIAHELCHVRNRDNFVAAFQMFVETVFWFHPLVWWIGKWMVAERERACDEEVLQLGNQPLVYAEGILNVCRLYAESPLACVAGVSGSDLKKRIHGIVSGRIGNDLGLAKKAALLAASAACLALPILIGVWHAPYLRGEVSVSVRDVPAATAKFRSAKITPCANYGMPRVANPSPGRLVLTCEGIGGLIQLAWLHSANPFPPPDDPNNLAETMTGGDPAIWAYLEVHRVNIDARADAGTSLEGMEGPMLQALLEDRYQLRVHEETRNIPMFSLTVAKGGAKLQPAKKDESFCGNAGRPNTPPLGRWKNCISVHTGTELYTNLYWEAISLQDFCNLLAGQLGGPVTDKTGIGGQFDFHLEFANNRTPGPLRNLYPPLPAVLEERLGLKVEKFSGPHKFLVVDHVEKPLLN